MSATLKDKREAYAALARLIHAFQQFQLEPSVVRCATGGLLNPGKLKAARSLLDDTAVALGDAVVASNDQLSRKRATEPPPWSETMEGPKGPQATARRLHNKARSKRSTPKGGE